MNKQSISVPEHEYQLIKSAKDYRSNHGFRCDGHIALECVVSQWKRDNTHNNAVTYYVDCDDTTLERMIMSVENTDIILVPEKSDSISLMPVDASKDIKYRINSFEQWQTDNGLKWYEANLPDYVTYLQNERNLSPSTIKAHLGTLRPRIKKLLKKPEIRDMLTASMPADTLAERVILMNEAIERIENAIASDNEDIKLKEITKQDIIDSDHLRLTPNQVEMLVNKPKRENTKGIRDTAIIALMACTGVREAELCNVKVDDLRQKSDGVLGLRVTNGKGNKARFVPYGDLSQCLQFVDAWLAHAGITKGYVFRGFYKGYKKIRDGKLNTSSINRTLAEYPIVIDGDIKTVKPHDLRRSYARNLYDAGMRMEDIQRNLGHADVKTTQLYVGISDANVRSPKAIYNFDIKPL